MSTSNQSFKDYSFAHHGEVFKILDSVFRSYGVSYYLIGANARDVALYKAGEKPIRATADIDFAVMVPGHEEFDYIKEELKKKGFEKDLGNMPYRLFHSKSKAVIDLLPFGGIEEESTVRFAESKLELSSVGMSQVASDIETFVHPEGFSIPVSPAHGLVILKLIAWSEKPGYREKDLGDTANILRIAWSIYEPELYSEDAEHSDLFEVEKFDARLIGARVMGRKMYPILQLDKALNKKIKLLLDDQIKAGPGLLTLAIAKALGCDLSFAKEMIKSLQQGAEENISP